MYLLTQFSLPLLAKFDLSPLTINLEKKRSLSWNNFPFFSKNSGDINTQYSIWQIQLWSPVKMEYGWNFSISGLNHEKWSRKNIFEIPPCAHNVIFITEFVLLIKISPIFHFDRGHQSWICHILLCVILQILRCQIFWCPRTSCQLYKWPVLQKN